MKRSAQDDAAIANGAISGQACRFDETAGDKVRWLKNIKDKEFWEQLGGNDNAEVDTDQQTAIDDRGGALLVSAAAARARPPY